MRRPLSIVVTTPTTSEIVAGGCDSVPTGVVARMAGSCSARSIHIEGLDPCDLQPGNLPTPVICYAFRTSQRV